VKKNICKGAVFFSLSTVSGVILLSFLSIFQKIAIGADPFMLKGFIVPTLFGGIAGGIIGNILFKNVQLIQLLKNTNVLLEDQVKERTKELNEKNKLLEDISNTDALTSVANRRHFDSFLSIECKRLSRSTSSLSLIMCDIDHFKIFNDTYGHQAGDECLKNVAAALRSIGRRETDFIARYGGEEFVIVLPDTKLEMAVHIAEKARNAVEKLRIPHKNTAHEKVVTMSFGVTSVSSGDNNKNYASILISKADEALYAAKKGGRNRVIQSKII
jgi:diguanylate cyclase (GGDEF)-like protein